MDTLCNGHEIQPRGLEAFEFSVPTLTPTNKRRHFTGKCTRIVSRSGRWNPNQQQPSQGLPAVDSLEVVEAATQDPAQWEAWAGTQELYDGTSIPVDGLLEEDRFALVVSSPVFLTGFNKLQDGATALIYSPVPRDCLFTILQRLFIHQAYISLLEDGSPCAIKINSNVQGRDCEVYLLRTSNAARTQSAIAITHFPAVKTQLPHGKSITIGARTNAFISGYDDEDLAALIRNLKKFNNFPSSPFRLLVSFLEVEQEKRFYEVRETVREMQDVIHTLAEEPLEAPSARQKLNKTVDLYFVVHHLRTDGLVSWRDKLKLLREQLQKAGNEEMTMYLDQVIGRYDHRICRCDMVLQGASLAYQMETTQLSRKDTEIAIGDGKTMKAIAVLTLIFLPGTFIATMLAVPQIEDALKEENDGSFGHSKWLWYIVLAIPVTVFALLAYASWEYCYKRKYIKSLFGTARNGKEDDMEMSARNRG